MVGPIPDRTPKTLIARPDVRGPLPRFLEARDPDAQAQAIVDEVIRHAAEGIPYHEQAVLMRAVRLEAGPLVAALEGAGIPHQVRGGVGLMERTEVRTALAWLRAAVDPTDAPAYLRIVGDPAWGVPWTLAADVIAARRSQPAARALCTAIADAGGSPAFAETLEDVGRAVTEGTAADRRSAPSSTAPTASAGDRGGWRGGRLPRGGAWRARAACGRARGRTPQPHRAGGRRPAQPAGGSRLPGRRRGAARAGVQVMTVHQAKGLKFDAVTVVGMTHFNWPGRHRPGPDIPDALLPEALPRDVDEHVAESRRLA